MIKNLNSIRNTIRDIEKDNEEYTKNGVAFIGVATDINTNETPIGYVGRVEDFFYMIACACVTFYENAHLNEMFKRNEFVDYLCNGIKETFKQVENKKKHKSRG